MILSKWILKLTMNDSESISVVDDLSAFQNQIYDKLKGIKVKYDNSRNSDVSEAITKLFGEQIPGSANYGYVTFDMYLKCLDVVREAGKLKADSIINRNINGI